MRSKSVAILAAAGMLLTSVTVYSLTPAGGADAWIAAAPDGVEVTPDAVGGDTQSDDLARFETGSTLRMEGRLGHAKLVRSSTGETFVMVEVRASDQAGAAAPVNLSLVIDRSGSMRGTRLANAIRAAAGAIERLRDGDVVSVVTFDTRTALVVPPTTMSSATRDRVIADIRGITLGGDTCISCGIEDGMAELDRTTGRVNRMIVLSDGDANNGVRDVTGFRSIAQRARDRGTSITTIGVDVDYNEKILSALALESNGRHYFVENDAALERAFEEEAVATTSSVATGAEVAIDLGPGVELDRVFDRSFRRSGSRVLVPLGTFARSEVKTVLLKVRVPSRADGSVTVANVDLAYRDLLTDSPASCSGKLATVVGDDVPGARELDAVVSGRVQRSETAATLKDANVLFAQGRVADARAKLEAQSASLSSEAKKAKSAAPKAKADSVDRDFERQLATLDEASNGFASPPQAASPKPGAAPPAPAQESRQGKGAVRANESNAFDLAF